MSAANTVAERAFDSISSVETIKFGTADSAYLCRQLLSLHQQKLKQQASVHSMHQPPVQVMMMWLLMLLPTHLQLLDMIGADDEDVNVKFIGGKGNDS